MTDLAARFEQTLRGLYDQIVREVAGYRPTAFLAMLTQSGGVDTAKRLNASMTAGFIRLWEADRLDLTVEATMIKVPYRRLFTRAELMVAQDRLDEVLKAPPQKGKGCSTR